jgi:hypothetical protein
MKRFAIASLLLLAACGPEQKAQQPLETADGKVLSAKRVERRVLWETSTYYDITMVPRELPGYDRVRI